VNPHDIGGLVDRMETALRMTPSEQAVRMKAMRQTVKLNDVHHWADSFLQTLAYAKA
jgi:trehalose 6-phosphate synthase